MKIIFNAIFLLPLILTILVQPSTAEARHGEPSKKALQFYRDLTLKIRPAASFKIPRPTGIDTPYNYELSFADPVYPQPIAGDIHFDSPKNKHFTRNFFDRILLKEGSYVQFGKEKLPLTCVFIDGLDNRFAGERAATFPRFVMKVYLVANDFSCTGPLNPGFPQNGGKEEAWDTYIYYEIRDPTIMLPVEAHVRYRWNETNAVLVK